MITFEEARTSAAQVLRAQWEGIGTFMVPEEGSEDDRAFLVTCGSREWLIDRDRAFINTDVTLALVDKRSGDVQLITYLDQPDRIDAMRDVSVR